MCLWASTGKTVLLTVNNPLPHILAAGSIFPSAWRLSLFSACIWSLAWKGKNTVCKRPSYICIHLNLNISYPSSKIHLNLLFEALKVLAPLGTSKITPVPTAVMHAPSEPELWADFFLVDGRKKEGPKHGLWASPSCKPTLAPSHWGPGKAPGSPVLSCLHPSPKAAASPWLLRSQCGSCGSQPGKDKVCVCFPGSGSLAALLWSSCKNEVSLTEICNKLLIACRLSSFFQRTSLFSPAPSFLSISTVLGFTQRLHYRYVFLLLHN